MNRHLLHGLLAGLLLLTGTVSAAMMVPISLQGLSIGAEKVVQAKVTATVAQWNADNTCIYTYVRMNISDDLFGPDDDNEIIIKQPGGRVGTMTLAVTGTAEYKVGEEDVLFLFRDEKNPAAYRTMGLSQGKFMVHRDAANVARVYQDTTRTPVLCKTGVVQSAPTGTAYLLDDFKKMIIQFRTDSTVAR